MSPHAAPYYEVSAGSCLSSASSRALGYLNPKVGPRCGEELILNWFRAKGNLFSGAAEGLNNKIRVITVRSYGFRTYKAMVVALFHTLVRLPEPAPIHNSC